MAMVWQGTNWLAMDRDQLIGQIWLFICWNDELTRESWLAAPVGLRLLLHDTGAEEVDPELASHVGRRGVTGPSWLDSCWSSLIADSSRGSCAVRAAAPWHPLSQPATAGVAEEGEEGRKWEQPIYIKGKAYCGLCKIIETIGSYKFIFWLPWYIWFGLWWGTEWGEEWSEVGMMPGIWIEWGQPAVWQHCCRSLIDLSHYCHCCHGNTAGLLLPTTTAVPAC